MTKREQQTLVFRGVKYEGVLSHPRRKSRCFHKLPNTIWIQHNISTKIFDVAKSFGYRYHLVGTVTRYFDDEEVKFVRFDKFRLINPDNVSGLRKPWE